LRSLRVNDNHSQELDQDRSMHDMHAEPVAAAATEVAVGERVRLSTARPGDRGEIIEVRAETRAGDHGVDVEELQRRLLEFGFVEGARVEVLHEGAVGRDPIAVRVENVTIAVRRREAMAVIVG
jgi:ferrous iron transport protein A